MNSLIKRLINWKVCLLFSGLFLLYLFLILPNESNKSDLITGGLVSPDTEFIYSAGFLEDLISSYSPEAREYYVVSKVRFDILWPLVYGIWLTSSIGLLIKGIKRTGAFVEKAIINWLPLLPLMAVGFDFLENLTLSSLMLLYPNTPLVLLGAAPIFTGLKWLTLSVSMLMAVVLLIYLLYRLIRKRKEH